MRVKLYHFKYIPFFLLLNSSYDDVTADVDIDNSEVIDYTGQADFLANYHPMDGKLIC